MVLQILCFIAVHSAAGAQLCSVAIVGSFTPWTFPVASLLTRGPWTWVSSVRAEPASRGRHGWWLWWPHSWHAKGNLISSIHAWGNDAAVAACQRHPLPHIPLVSGLNLAPRA